MGKPMQIVLLRMDNEYSSKSVSLPSVNLIIYFVELDRI